MIEIAEAKREKERRLKELPKETAPRQLNAPPPRADPETDMELPSRATARMDNDEPMVMKSNTE
jgi:hypothetical protein